MDEAVAVDSSQEIVVVDRDVEGRFAAAAAASSLLRAVIAGDVALAERCIRAGADIRQIHPVYKQSLAFFAAAYAAAAVSAGGCKTTMLGLLVEGHGLEANPVDSNGQTPLFYAAKEGGLEACRYLMEHSCDPGHTDIIADQTPLFYAAKHCRTDCVSLLLEGRCPVDEADKNGRTALFFAGNSGAVVALVEGGASLNAVDAKGMTAAMLHTQAGQSEQLAALIEARADVSLVSKENKTCWQYAQQHKGHVVYKVLERFSPTQCKQLADVPPGRAQPVAQPVTRAKAAAATGASPQAARRPVTRRATAAQGAPPAEEAHADPSASSSSSARSGGYIQRVSLPKAPVEKAPVSVRSWGYIQRVSLPKARGAMRKASAVTSQPMSPSGPGMASHLDISVDQSYLSPVRKSACWVVSEHGKLHLGASLDKAIRLGGGEADVEEIIKATVHEFGLKPEDILLNAGGKSWITYAACREHDALAICQILHRYGVDPTKVDELGQTPLFYAVRMNEPPAKTAGGVACARWLLEAKCDPNHKDVHGNRPLDYAAKNEDARCAQELIVAGADPNLVSSASGYTVLSIAVGGGHVDTARVLLEAKCDPNERMESHMGGTAVFLARNESVLDLLLAHRANVNERDSLGRTPLAIAAWNCALSSLKALVSRAADVNIADNHGDTCLTLAAPNERCAQVCKYLIAECGMDPLTVTRLGPTVGELVTIAEQLELTELERVRQEKLEFEPNQAHTAKRPRQADADASDEASPQDEDGPMIGTLRPRSPAPVALALEDDLRHRAAGRGAGAAAAAAVAGLTRCTIGFKDESGTLMPLGSPEYLEALKELIELCPELQAWHAQDIVPMPSGCLEDGRWVDLSFLDEADEGPG